MLTGRPQRPSAKREWSNGSRRILLAVTQPIETMYDERRAQTPRETIWLKVIVEPILMSESAQEKAIVNKTANSTREVSKRD
jgi:hypothetical protein